MAKVAFTFPPDNDGELHVQLIPTDTGYDVSFSIAVPPEEKPLETLRRIGQIFSNQPVRSLREQ